MTRAWRPTATALPLWLVLMTFGTGGTAAWAYPLDGTDYTGISRLQAGQRIQQGQMKGRRVHQGALLPLNAVDIRLADRQLPPLDQVPLDATLTGEIVALLGDDADHYAVALLDVSDPDQPRYAAHQAEQAFSPGSIGKLLIALGLFQALADLYPDDIARREHILRTTTVVADQFIDSDHHEVPFWQPGDSRIRYRPIQREDHNTLWGTLDWMMSASSNAAASLVLRELVLMTRFQHDYPPTAQQARQFWLSSRKKERSALLHRALQRPVERNGLSLNNVRQGGFFTWKGKQLVPGTSSRATPRGLLQLLYRLEQGLLVDRFSSRELKRLLYMTEKRIRYASSPALNDAAVYFKSGSLYRCRPEAGYVCKKYQGNVDNLLNSVAIIESPATAPRLHYLVVVMSNVLRTNSAVAHQTLATRIHRLLQRDQAQAATTGQAGQTEGLNTQSAAALSAAADEIVEGDDEVGQPASR